MHLPFRAWLLALFAVVLVGCGGGTTDDVPTLSLPPTPALATTLSNATISLANPAVVTTTLTDGKGAPVAGQVVTFSVVRNLAVTNVATALTNASGQATVTLTPVNAAAAGADEVTAKATVAGLQVQSTVGFQIQPTDAGSPTTPALSTTLSTTSISSANPAIVTTTLTDAKGAPVAGQVVTFSVARNLAVTSVATALTNASGQATVTLTPVNAAAAGADEVTAKASVAGLQVQSTVGFQVQPTDAGAPTTPALLTTLSTTSISSANPAIVTSTLTDAKGAPVAGQVVTFSVARSLAVTNVATALTNDKGQASVILAPANSTTAGADEVSAKATLAGTQLQSTVGFQIQATNVTLTAFTSAVPSLGAYGQTTLTVALTGASVGSPVNVTVTSNCVSQGKATLSPATFTATSGTVDLQFKDNGCGALQSQDKLQAAIAGGSGAPVPLTLPIAVPDEASVAFISASPEVIYLKGSGFTETSTLVLEVRDRAGNPLPGRTVNLALLTKAGGPTIEGGAGPVSQVSDSAGRVAVRVNSGTVPTPIRVSASLAATPSIATVSSNLSVAVGMPSQLNFSLSQQTPNIEGFNRDGTPNTYTVIMSDRSGNPVPTGTSVNFVAEGGQIEAVVQTSTTPVAPKPGSGTGLSTASAKFQSSNPRPADGRVTITAYALGEESFIDLNGNNAYDAGEPFQDLGNVFKDRLFDGVFDPTSDEFISTGIASGSACAASGNPLLALDASIPSVPGTCDGVWSGAGKVYVRRATETVLSTSGARALWASKSGLDASCAALTLQTGPATATTSVFTLVQGGETWYTGGEKSYSTTLPFIVADANTFTAFSASGAIGRLNPMAAGTTITATSPTKGVTLTIAGSPVPNTTEATGGGVGVAFDPANAPAAAVVFVNFTSPSGTVSTYSINVALAARPSACP